MKPFRIFLLAFMFPISVGMLIILIPKPNKSAKMPLNDLKVSEKVPISFVEGDQNKATGIATGYVKSLKEYQDGNGDDVIVLDIVQVNCEGCWEMSLEFSVKNPSENKRVILDMNDWEVMGHEFVKETSSSVFDVSNLEL